ncbi:MAG: hypothetical protein GY850_33215 [bacterium]|nr:hypothetical protein [bacterium]
MTDLIIQLLSGMNFVLVLIMVAMGLMIIFGLMNVINMAHGEFFLLGAYTAVMTNRIGIGFWPALVLVFHPGLSIDSGGRHRNPLRRPGRRSHRGGR